jgi:competence protein ComEA
MIKRLKSLFKNFFTLSKGEQRAIIILLILVILITWINFFLPTFIQKTPPDFSKFKNEIEAFREDQQYVADSLAIIQLQNRGELDRALAQQKLKPFKFDPNDLPAELWKKMGLTDQQIEVIKNYERKGGTFTQKEDLKRMYCLSDAEYQVLEPYITIKSPYKTISENQPERLRTVPNPVNKEPVYKVVELNSATSQELTESLHLPEWLSKRVVKYRDLLGGFSNDSQLAEVYGFDSSRIEKLDDYITIDLTNIKQLDLNSSSFKEILHHPYISYEITKQIANYRENHNGFKTIEELVDSNIVSGSLFIKLKPYLRAGQQ